VSDFGRKCRNIIQQDSEVLGYSLAGDSQAADAWSTSVGGEYLAAGVGCGIAGRRADFGLIDDYLGNQEDADSKTIRDKQKAWYDNDFWPRLKPNAIQVIVANRRHEDDLVGRLLSEEPDEWLVIRLPMLAEENDPLGRKVGERLWPEYFTEDMVNKARRHHRTWGGLYQQRPSPEEGNYFKAEWIVPYDQGKLPLGLSLYCASDHACTKRESSKDDPDWTLLVPFGLDEGMNVWILPDFYWEQADTGAVVTNMIRLMKEHKPIAWVAETEHIVKSIGPFLRQTMRDENIYTTRIQELSGRRDKESKCRSIQGRMEFRKVFFPTFEPRWTDVQDQILTFPAGSHDEWPDVLGTIGRYIDRFIAGEGEPKEEKPTEIYGTFGWLMKRERQKQREHEAAMNGY
jgi:predicted phage terminase large subunit-like protein